MSKLIKLQIRTVFSSPVPYLLVFLVMPILYILCSSFLPAAIVLPGIIVTMITSITFFVFGSSLMQVKNSVVYKRMEANGLSRSKFIFANGSLSTLFSLLGVYVFIQFFGAVNAVGNYEWFFLNPQQIESNHQSYEEINLYVPMHFNIFAIDDIFNALDDGIYLVLLDFINEADDIDLLIEALTYYVDNISGPLVDAIIEPIIAWLVEANEAGDIDKRIQALYDDFEKNGAAIDIVTTIILNPLPTDGSGNASIYWNGDSTIYNSASLYAFYWSYPDSDIFFNDRLFYIHISPTISTLVSPLVNWNTQLDVGGEKIMLISFWLNYLLIICLLSLLIYSLMIVFVSASKNFEQYMLFSGVTLVTIMLCSGLFMPFAWILSTPMLFVLFSLFPTTSLVFQFQYLWRHEDQLIFAVQQTDSPLWSYVYPIVLAVCLLTITSRLLSNENGKLTTKFEHDTKSRNASILNIVLNMFAITIFVTIYYLLIFKRSENAGNVNDTNLYPTNLKIFVIQMSIVIYIMLIFSNFIFLLGKSTTLFKHSRLFFVLNAILLIPVGIVSAVLGQTSMRIEKRA